MPSYQRDYPFNENLIVKAVEDWKTSDTYKKLCVDRDYFNGDNVTVRELKKYYWSDPKKQIVNGVEKLIGGGFVENKFTANNKIAYGFYPDMVKQKVDTLLTEIPQITAQHKFKPQFLKNLGYSIKQAGLRAAGQGVSYLYLDWQNNLTVFKPECCIPYYDDMNGNLTALIRFWEVDKKGTVIYYIETYTQAGLTTYTTDNHFQVIKPLTPYKFRKLIDFQGETIQGEQIGLPIIVFRNDDNLYSDLRPNIRSKIDAIDTVQSGFNNNIDDFSELYWVVKNSSGMDESTFLDFQASIN
jgi:hypothetical protein